MKIIRKGGPWSLNVECTHCKSLLLLEENDVVIHWANDPRPTQQTHDYCFICAVCNKATVLKYGDMPDHVRQLAMLRDKTSEVGKVPV